MAYNNLHYGSTNGRMERFFKDSSSVPMGVLRDKRGFPLPASRAIPLTAANRGFDHDISTVGREIDVANDYKKRQLERSNSNLNAFAVSDPNLFASTKTSNLRPYASMDGLYPSSSSDSLNISSSSSVISNTSSTSSANISRFNSAYMDSLDPSYISHYVSYDLD
ncbi:hypothetical protein BCR32DRAFT_329254 [Anaeromyces robustus]|uniref:Uncharacterized protein n=1 Tax=Anaeromyces robustus TaxID=1754192 RepID=A0A1Y1WTW1_9FUNG|nr:hypothetical protein BCR32DRAFT_329254 [Anaeromyces robustus]|eukprot:ORX76676.1 hypothetical protein BCR32DRAFT_329254 [Anaeromyces robustus]